MITAQREAKWRTTSKASPWSGQSKNFGKMTRWAEEETGKNSVKPWIKAKMTVWKISIKLILKPVC